MDGIRGLLGLAVLVGIAFLFSLDRKRISWRLVIIGIILQVTFGVLISYIDFVKSSFAWISGQFVTVIGFALEGSRFIFGSLVDSQSFGVIFAVQVLPTVIFFSMLTSGLYYLGVLQKLVKGIAWVMARSMRLSGGEALSAAGNIFVGQTEAPMLVKPFIPKMTRSELMCLMTGGMATIAGGVLAAYVALLGGDNVEEQTQFAAYLLTASFMNAPAAIIMAKIMIPEPDPTAINTDLTVAPSSMGVNLIDSLARGTSEGLKLAANIGAMLLTFVALIGLLNHILAILGGWIGVNELIVSSTAGTFDGLSLQYILGQIFRVFAFVIGVEWQESLQVGSLLGLKIALNEFVAYEELAQMMSAGSLSPKSVIISTYALCGFANFSSIAIQIGGIGGMAPSQQGNISKLGLRALLAATLATMMTATVAGVLMG